jgi:hypothetical protein
MFDIVRHVMPYVVMCRFVYSIFGLTCIPPNLRLFILEFWYNSSMTIHSLTTLSNTTATLLTPSGLHSGMDITIQNTHASAIVYIGGAGVTSSNYGYRISPNNAWSIELSGKDALYAVSDTNGSAVAVLKTSLELGK